LQEKEGAIQEQLGMLQDSGQSAAAERLQPLAAEMSIRLNELNSAVQERIVVGRQRSAGTTALRAAHEKLLKVLGPLVEDTGFSLVEGLQAVSQEAEAQDIARRLTGLADRELAAFE